RDGHVTGVQTCALPISLGILLPGHFKVLNMFPMHVLEMSGQEYAQRAADYLGLRISKNLLGTLIEQDNALLGINRDDRVLGDFRSEERRVGKEWRFVWV